MKYIVQRSLEGDRRKVFENSQKVHKINRRKSTKIGRLHIFNQNKLNEI